MPDVTESCRFELSQTLFLFKELRWGDERMFNGIVFLKFNLVLKPEFFNKLKTLMPLRSDWTISYINQSKKISPEHRGES